MEITKEQLLENFISFCQYPDDNLSEFFTIREWRYATDKTTAKNENNNDNELTSLINQGWEPLPYMYYQNQEYKAQIIKKDIPSNKLRTFIKKNVNRKLDKNYLSFFMNSLFEENKLHITRISNNNEYEIYKDLFALYLIYLIIETTNKNDINLGIFSQSFYSYFKNTIEKSVIREIKDKNNQRRNDLIKDKTNYKTDIDIYIYFIDILQDLFFKNSIKLIIKFPIIYINLQKHLIIVNTLNGLVHTILLKLL